MGNIIGSSHWNKNYAASKARDDMAWLWLETSLYTHEPDCWIKEVDQMRGNV